MYTPSDTNYASETRDKALPTLKEELVLRLIGWKARGDFLMEEEVNAVAL